MQALEATPLESCACCFGFGSAGCFSADPPLHQPLLRANLLLLHKLTLIYGKASRKPSHTQS